jgi:hypothetical protein
MIPDDEGLKATHEALGLLYSALASLRKTMLPVHPRQYRLFAEAPIDEIGKLQAEIDAYLGLDQPEMAPREEPVLRETPPPYNGSGK